MAQKLLFTKLAIAKTSDPPIANKKPRIFAGLFVDSELLQIALTRKPRLDFFKPSVDITSSVHRLSCRQPWHQLLVRLF